jgi:hypothetical protein
MIKKLLFSIFFLGTVAGAYAFSVTFRVDMSQQSGFTTPEVNGSFNNWCGGCFPMTDVDGDNIWEATTDLPSGTIEYKFAADVWGTQENLIAGSSCTVTNFGFTNRTLAITADVVLPVVCWGSCIDCESTPSNYTVVFQVDMSGQSGFTTPEVNGTFNSWCGNCTPMQDLDGDNVWSVAVTLPEGNYEYKYSHDNWGGQESLAAGSSCTTTSGTFTNRTLVLDANMTLDPVCWSSCAACGQSTGPYNVVFSVDMSNVDFAYTTPEVNGTFNDWCGNCTAMSDPDGDDIWTVTVSLPVGTHTYKFSHDLWSGQEELIPGSPCTLTESGFTNRTINVTAPAELDPVCWGSCEICAVGVDESIESAFSIYPNPASEMLTIDSNKGEINRVTITDMAGRTVYSASLASMRRTQIDVSMLPAGTYVVTMENNTELLRRAVQLVK